MFSSKRANTLLQLVARFIPFSSINIVFDALQYACDLFFDSQFPQSMYHL